MRFNWRHIPLFVLAMLGLSLGLAAQALKPVPALVKQQRDAGAPFEQFKPFEAAGVLDDKAAQFAREAQFLTLNERTLLSIVRTRPQTMSLALPYNGKTVVVDLVQKEVLSEDFAVETSASGGRPVEFVPGAHYRGILRGDNNSIAAFSFFEDDVMGLISDGKYGNRVLGKLDVPGNKRDYIFYDDSQLAFAPPFECHTEDPPLDPKELDGNQSVPEVNGCVRIFFEVDFELFSNKGSVQNTLNYVSGAFNQMATLYNNETIQTQLSQVFVWVNADFYSTSSSSTVLSQFAAFRTSFNADLAHHVGIGGNNYGGIAYLDGLCTSNAKYAVSDINTSFSNVPTYSWTIMVLTHETGHNLGSRHTHWCGWTGGAIDNCATPEGSCNPGPAPTNGGTIMSYCHLTSAGINFNNGFGPQPGNKIRTTVQAKTCLAANCTAFNSCTPPSGITVTNIATTTATVSWTAVTGATSYQLQYRAVGAANWTTINAATSPQNLTGLPANDEVEVALRSTCGAINSGYRYGVIFKTLAASSCAAPTGVTASNVTQTTATVSWTAVAGAVSYNVWRKLSSATNWGTATNTTATTINYTGLAANTSYDVRVQTVCSGGGTSSAFGTVTFTTQSASSCNAPSTVTASNIAQTTATVSWTAATGAVSYNVWRKLSSATNWGNPTNTASTTLNYTGLTANTSYDVRVQTVCASGSSTTYGTTSFTTLAAGNTCPAPTNVATSSITQTSAVVSWAAAQGATSYQVWRKLSSTTNWGSATTVTGTSTTLTGLVAGTSYDVRVRTVCASGSSTNYGTTTFTTQTPPASCSAPSGIVATPFTSTDANIAWNPVAGATNYDLRYRLSTAGAFISVTGIPGTSYDLFSLIPGATYVVQVRAFCSTTGSYSAFSADVFFTMPTSKPGESTGEKTISETITEDRTGQSASALSASINLVPNPASALVQVNLNFDKTENVRLELLDLYGKVIESQRVTLREGSVEFELSDLPQGIYFVRTLAGNHAPVTKRLVKD